MSTDFRIGAGPFFERGIDSITHQGENVGQGLPDPHALTPSDHAVRPVLDQLLAVPNLETFLESITKPDLDDRDILMPGRFRQALDGVISSIKDAVDERQSTDPQAVKVLNRAARLLNEEVALRDLLHMYRSVLFQG